MLKRTKRKTTLKMILAARDMRRNQTFAEQVLWDTLRNNNFHGLKFRRQHPVGNSILDFFCVKYQLAIEVDGSIHHATDQRKLDADREEKIKELGIQIIRFSNDEVTHHVDSVIQKILSQVKKIQADRNFLSDRPSPVPQERERG
jgi:very-short-patch-repair endonuclease